VTLEEFLEAAWHDHAERAADVATRLERSLALVAKPDDVAPFVRIATHVFGEHLGEWQRGIDLLDAIRGQRSADGDAATSAIVRGIATLGVARGDAGALDGLSPEDRVFALAGAAAAFAGRNAHRRAIDAYARALADAKAGLPAKSPAIRALAIGGNNLACALEEKRDRDAAETGGMVRAAEAALECWRLAGTWLEEERAHYRLARSLLAAGRSEAAIASAQRCVDVCAANEAPAFERFFGEAALALAQRAAGDGDAFAATRARALAWHDRVEADERQWCASDLGELGA
jgi:hypothetical protein